VVCAFWERSCEGLCVCLCTYVFEQMLYASVGEFVMICAHARVCLCMRRLAWSVYVSVHACMYVRLDWQTHRYHSDA
jgi:hypothetical protein